MISYTETQLLADGQATILGWIVIWKDLRAGDIGRPVSHCGYSRQSIQAEGDFGGAASVVCDGTNDGWNFRPLKSPVGSPVDIMQGDIVAVGDPTISVRPRMFGGDATTRVTVTMIFLRHQ
jgi:hypothetical protein